MTTTLPPTPTSTVLRRAAVSGLTDHALLHRALRSGLRLAAAAVTGVAFDDRCDAARRRELVRWTAGVLVEVRAHAALRRELEAALSRAVLPGAVLPGAGGATAGLGSDAALDAALARARRALLVFARDASAGAPLLAVALTDLGGLVEDRLDAEEAGVLPLVSHVPAAERDRAVRAARRLLPPGQDLFTLPWLLDACHPAERATVLRTASRSARLVLRVAAARHGRMRDAVLGLPA
jgi:hypothetical protein